jgi:Xaa-Pro aminopeptidase
MLSSTSWPTWTAFTSVYFPNFAVHVEDTFLITEDGYEVLTPCSRDLRIARA